METERRNLAQHCLTKIPTIVDPILSNLSAKDLSTAACVCWFWHASTQRIWSKRRYFLSKLLEGDENDEHEFQMSVHDMMVELCKFTENVKIYPSAAIIYVSQSQYTSVKNYERHIKKMIANVSATLPRNCRLFGAVGGGIIGSNNSKSFEVEQHSGISAFFFPRISGVTVTDFFITKSDINAAGKDTEKWKALLNYSNLSNVKLVLLTACSAASGIEDTIKMLGKIFDSDIIIAGGVAESVIHERRFRKRGISGLVFAGNLSASLVVHKTQDGLLGNDKETFFENLQRLKGSLTDNRFSFIFMYSCVLRGLEFFLDNNVQTQWIAEVFPGIPVFGMFAFGEIGFKPSQVENKSTGYHAYSTVLCLCGI